MLQHFATRESAFVPGAEHVSAECCLRVDLAVRLRLGDDCEVLVVVFSALGRRPLLLAASALARGGRGRGRNRLGRRLARRLDLHHTHTRGVTCRGFNKPGPDMAWGTTKVYDFHVTKKVVKSHRGTFSLRVFTRTKCDDVSN